MGFQRELWPKNCFVFFVFWQVLSFFLVCFVFWRSGRHPDVGPQLESHRWGVKIQGVRAMPPWLINVPGKCSTITPVCNPGDEQQTAPEQKKNQSQLLMVHQPVKLQESWSQFLIVELHMQHWWCFWMTLRLWWCQVDLWFTWILHCTVC